MLFNYSATTRVIVDVFVYASLAITLDLEPALHLARGADHRRAGDLRHDAATIADARRQIAQIAVASACSACCSARACGPSRLAQAPPKQAVVETTAGTFVIDLDAGGGAESGRVLHEAGAAEGGYDGTIFHRVVKYGMVQGGDPLSKDPAKRALYGTGGLNAVKAEARAPKMTRGSVAAVLVPGKPDSAGAQFFIVLADQPALDSQYTVFGHVVGRHGGRCRRSRRRRSTTRASATERVEITRVTIRDTPRRAVRHRDAAGAWRATARCSTPAPGRSRSSSFPTRRPNTVRQFLRLAAGRRLQRHGVSSRRAGLRHSDRRARQPRRRRSPRSSRSSCTTCRRSSTTRST